MFEKQGVTGFALSAPKAARSVSAACMLSLLSPVISCTRRRCGTRPQAEVQWVRGRQGDYRQTMTQSGDAWQHLSVTDGNKGDLSQL